MDGWLFCRQPFEVFGGQMGGHPLKEPPLFCCPATLIDQMANSHDKPQRKKEQNEVKELDGMKGEKWKGELEEFWFEREEGNSEFTHFDLTSFFFVSGHSSKQNGKGCWVAIGKGEFMTPTEHKNFRWTFLREILPMPSNLKWIKNCLWMEKESAKNILFNINMVYFLDLNEKQNRRNYVWGK
jgi:hypothetical protein